MKIDLFVDEKNGFELKGIGSNSDNSEHLPVIKFRAHGIYVQSDFYFEPESFTHFAQSICKGYDELSGEAELCDPNDPYPCLKMQFTSIGHVKVIFENTTWGEIEQSVHIGFICDQSYLIPMVQMLRQWK